MILPSQSIVRVAVPRAKVKSNMITNRQYTLRCIHTSLAFVFWSLILCTPFLLQTVQPDFPWNQPIIDALNNDSMDLTAICPVNLTRYASNTQWVVKSKFTAFLSFLYFSRDHC